MTGGGRGYAIAAGQAAPLATAGTHGSDGPGRQSRIDRAATGRLVWTDNVKVLLISLIIALHGVLSYAATLEVWTSTACSTPAGPSRGSKTITGVSTDRRPA